MVFDIDEIPEEGLDFEILKEKSHFQIDLKDCSLTKDVDLKGTLRKIEKDVYFNGKVNAGLLVQCSRCLELFEIETDSLVSARFVPKSHADGQDAEIELHVDDIDTEPYEGNRIDLTQTVRDQILLSLPAVCVCKESCEGLCPECGVNRNLVPCDCLAELDTDPRLKILKTLKDKLK